MAGIVTPNKTTKSHRTIPRATMSAFNFGWRLSKLAASGPEGSLPAGTGDPDFEAMRARYVKANLPPAAWQYAGLPPLTPEQLNNASAADIWHINNQIANKDRASYSRAYTPQQVNSFNSARTYARSMRKQYNPVFAAEGSPGYKPPLSSINGGAAPATQTAAPAAPPAQQAGQNPQQFGAAVANNVRFPDWKTGDPLPAGTIPADDDRPIAISPDAARIGAVPQPRPQQPPPQPRPAQTAKPPIAKPPVAPLKPPTPR